MSKASPTAVLGQPLNATMGLTLESGETLEARCVKADVSFGDRPLSSDAVQTRVETLPGSGQRRIRVSTTVAVDEPVVSLHVFLGCPVRLARDFMLFADPPGRTPAIAGDAADPAWQADRPESPLAAVLPVPARASAPAASGPAPRSRARRSESAQAQPADRTPDAGTAAPAPRRSANRASQAPARPSGGAVLRLDPVEADALILPSLQMDTRLSTPDPSASGVANRSLDPEQQQRVQDLERLKAMEATLLKLRSDSQATQKSLDDLTLRLRTAESARYANPLVYALAGLCAALALGLVALWWRRRRDLASAQWWAAQPEAEAAVVAVPSPAVASSPADLPPPAPQPVRTEPPPVPNFPAAPLAPLPTLTTVAVPRTPVADSDFGGVGEPRRPMSAEELIDLEQQAEFFVVLGQDDAAIDLLMGHVRSTGGVSPLPYLKLLEIYRRRGERDPYDRIRERFNRRFNAYAPEWDVDPETGLSLEGYPEVMHKLQDAWESPSRSMELLDGALFKRNAGPTFDVPAYRELLFLYGLARDLAERAIGPEGVDLLLPFDDDGSGGLDLSIEPASAESSPAVVDDDIGRFTLDLDVSSDRPPLSLDDEPLSLKDRPLSLDDKPLSLDDKPLSLDDKPLSLDDNSLSLEDNPDFKKRSDS